MKRVFFKAGILLTVFLALILYTDMCRGAGGVGLTPPEGYEWASTMGALRSSDDPNLFVFDTYDSLTKSKEGVLQMGQLEKEAQKVLTDQAFDVWSRLWKLDDVAGIAVTFRSILIRKFPLAAKENLLPKIHAILDKPPEPVKKEPQKTE
jgi:hypothetical protein